MKVIVKSPFIDRNGLHKKLDIVEVETCAFNPFTMVELPEKKAAKVKVETQTEAVTDEAEKPVKKTRKRKE